MNKNSENPKVGKEFQLAVIEVVAALIWDKDKFLICQRPANKARALLWEFVGGKVEPGETKEQALIRECQEELAITLSVGEMFMDVVHEYPDIKVHLTLFNATIAEGVPQRLEHNDIKWITPSEIPQYTFCPADEEILSKILEKSNDMTFEDLHLSLEAYNKLKSIGFDDINKFLDTPIRHLRFQVRPDKLLAGILRQLDARGIRRKDCSLERYPTIDDYIRMNLKCCECYEYLSQEGSDTVRCLCKNCIDRLKRVESEKIITVDIKKPEYASYSNGHEGLTLFINLVNRTNAPFKVKLQEFTLTHRNTQSVSDYHYTGYEFDEDYLFPDTIKAIGKIWVTEKWEEKQITQGDYCVIILKSQVTQKQYYYKFVFNGLAYWEFHDYYELD